MHTFRRHFLTIAATGLVAFATGVCSGCSADKKETTQKATAEVKHVRAQVAAIEKAKSFKVALDNPKMGECPVCGNPVNYESFVMIGHKRYALCSDECAEKLQNEPEQYLAAAQP